MCHAAPQRPAPLAFTPCSPGPALSQRRHGDLAELPRRNLPDLRIHQLDRHAARVADRAQLLDDRRSRNRRRRAESGRASAASSRGHARRCRTTGRETDSRPTGTPGLRACWGRCSSGTRRGTAPGAATGLGHQRRGRLQVVGKRGPALELERQPHAVPAGQLARLPQRDTACARDPVCSSGPAMSPATTSVSTPNSLHSSSRRAKWSQCWRRNSPWLVSSPPWKLATGAVTRVVGQQSCARRRPHDVRDTFRACPATARSAARRRRRNRRRRVSNGALSDADLAESWASWRSP